MSRPPRTSFPGAFYHVTSRGNRKANIYLDERDYLTWFDLFGITAERVGFICHGFCLMPNHFHLLLQTPEANISEGMHYLNCQYSQYFNFRHDLTGHVLQGRFHSVLLEQQSHFTELGRYITLNPVRAKLVESASEWRWSNFRYTAGLATPPDWLNVRMTLEQFAGPTDTERTRSYREFVAAGIGGRNPLAPPQLPDVGDDCNLRYAAIAAAIRSGKYSQKELAQHFRISPKTLRRIAAEL